MKHEKTFEAINKLKDVEIELHRLKNLLEITGRALDAKSEWVGLTNEQIVDLVIKHAGFPTKLAEAIEAKLKEKNEAQTRRID